MPDLTSQSLAFEGIASQQQTDEARWLVYTSDTALLTSGHSADFMVITLPFPDQDSAVWTMVSGCSLMAGPLFSEWENINKDGLLIDLRLQPVEKTERADFLLDLSTKGLKSIPIILLWDPGSHSRADYFRTAIQPLFNFDIRLTPISEVSGQVYRRDCFQPTPLSLDNP